MKLFEKNDLILKSIDFFLFFILMIILKPSYHFFQEKKIIILIFYKLKHRITFKECLKIEIFNNLSSLILGIRVENK